MKTVAIVGGGASGLVAAIAAAERVRDLGIRAEVVIYEGDERVGRPILATGNGRCNFSNSQLAVEKYRNAEFVRKAYDCLEDPECDEPAHQVMGFLESCGLEWREESDGRRYPLANKASVVVDVLRAAAARLDVHMQCGKAVKAVEPPRGEGKRFTLRMEDGVFERADVVVVSCGGRALKSLDVEGLRRTVQRPVLGPLRVVDADIPFVRELDNIRVRCDVMLLRGKPGVQECLASESGELMFRKYGVSGICVFDLSRIAEVGDVLRIDLLKADELDRAENYLLARRAELVTRFGERLTCADMLRGLVLPRVSEALLKRAGMKEEDVCDKARAKKLAELLTRLNLEVAGIGDADICQVQRGGFSVEQFDPATLQATAVPGLFATGEALDVDGPCGGYNLHWAWASGLLAGHAAAEHANLHSKGETRHIATGEGDSR
ncbi:MAG: aminoacetone oxidase family FAD-binding enzyme [Eggerthellaceae bacterium]|nr:aminoacetone oxidase family FAD-binding enzyme [Eggerthellaceae bacterium]